MADFDPFLTYISSETTNWILRFLERRWGLALVSFLPLDTQQRLVLLQHEISRLIVGRQENDLGDSRIYIEYHDPEQFHGTHFVLAPSQPNGPVRISDLVGDDRDPIELLKRIQEIAVSIGPIEVELTRLEIFRVLIVLFGQCVDAARNRQRLLAELNRSLLDTFNVAPRPFETDKDRFSEIHYTLGVIKRSPQKGYAHFKEQLCSLTFEKIRFTLDGMSLVHHKHNSLKLPHEGIADFPFGRKPSITLNKMFENLNLG